MQIFVWDRRFLLHAPSFVLPRAAKAHKRLSATILIARDQPFAVEGIGKAGQRFQGVILAPNVARSALDARDSQFFLLDAGITTNAFQRLRSVFTPGAARELTKEELARVRPLLSSGELDCAKAARLFDAIVEALAGTPSFARPRDPRLDAATKLVESLPLDEITLPLLAEHAGVSPSRLRALFQQSFGCAPAQYMRWVNAWKAIRAWRIGMRITDVAHDAGFHDLAHIDHAMKDLFGMSPSMIALGANVRFQQCENG